MLSISCFKHRAKGIPDLLSLGIAWLGACVLRGIGNRRGVLADAAQAAEAAPVVLPPSLRNNVAVLEAPNPTAPGGKTSVYLLAMSHVSKKSVDQVGTPNAPHTRNAPHTSRPSNARAWRACPVRRTPRCLTRGMGNVLSVNLTAQDTAIAMQPHA